MAEIKDSIRKIIHVDMDAFYASVEQLDKPELKGKPVAVGGGEQRGVVAAASYEARKFGVRSAVSGQRAKQLCPDLIFVKPRFPRYQELSATIRSIFYQYTELVEPLSLDEAFLDVTHNKKGMSSATLIASEIRKQIVTTTGLTASAGISINKFLAKIASDINKPNGQKTIPPENVQTFLDDLDVRKFYGIGTVTSQKLYSLGIFKGRDLRAKELSFLMEHFGSQGSHFYQLARGIHSSEVQPERIAKSVAVEHTFTHNLSSEVFLLDELKKLAALLEKRLIKHQLSGRTISLKIKYSDFRQHTRSRTGNQLIQDKESLFSIGKELLLQERLNESVRLLGISLSNLNSEEKSSAGWQQLTLEF